MIKILRSSRGYYCAGSLLLALTTTSCIPLLAGFRDTLVESYQVAPGGKLTVDVEIGSVHVGSWDKEEVDIKVIRKVRHGDEEDLSRHEVEFSQDQGDVSIIGTVPDSIYSLWKQLTIEYRITVPDHYDLDLKTRAGSIHVGDLAGEVQLQSLAGSIKIGEVEGDVLAHTLAGSIHVEKVTGDIRAETLGGSIKLGEVMGAIEAQTAAGSIRATLLGQPKTDCRFSTNAGSVKVSLREGVDVTVDARTKLGGVRSDFPLNTEGRLTRGRVHGDIGEGGPRLVLRTSAGSIHLRRL